MLIFGKLVGKQERGRELAWPFHHVQFYFVLILLFARTSSVTLAYPGNFFTQWLFPYEKLTTIISFARVSDACQKHKADLNLNYWLGKAPTIDKSQRPSDKAQLHLAFFTLFNGYYFLLINPHGLFSN